MRSLLLPLLFLALGLLTTCASAQDDSFLIQNPADSDTSRDAYYAATHEPLQPGTAAPEVRLPESRISAVVPPVDLITRESAVDHQSASVRVAPAQATVSVENQTLPTFANENKANSNSSDSSMIRVAQRKTVWPAQASPFPVNPAPQPMSREVQPPVPPMTLPVAVSNDEEYYVPTKPVAAPTTSAPIASHVHHRPIQRDVAPVPTTGRASKCCDEWKDFCPCNRIDYDCPCNGWSSGTADNCGCHANCPGGRKGKHQGKGCGAGHGAKRGGSCGGGGQDCQCETCRGKRQRDQSSTCHSEPANGGEFNADRYDGNRESAPRRFSVLTININR